MLYTSRQGEFITQCVNTSKTMWDGFISQLSWTWKPYKMHFSRLLRHLIMLNTICTSWRSWKPCEMDLSRNCSQHGRQRFLILSSDPVSMQRPIVIIPSGLISGAGTKQNRWFSRHLSHINHINMPQSLPQADLSRSKTSPSHIPPPPPFIRIFMYSSWGHIHQ